MDRVLEKLGVPTTYRHLGFQFVGYFFVAGTAAVVDLITVFATLQLSTLHYLYAIGFGFMAGTSTNFLLSSTFIFSRTGNVLAVYLKHVTSSFVGLTVNVSVVVSLVELFGIPVLIAKVCALGCSFFVNFFLIKFFAFRDHRF